MFSPMISLMWCVDHWGPLKVSFCGQLTLHWLCFQTHCGSPSNTTSSRLHDDIITTCRQPSSPGVSTWEISVQVKDCVDSSVMDGNVFCVCLQSLEVLLQHPEDNRNQIRELAQMLMDGGVLDELIQHKLDAFNTRWDELMARVRHTGHSYIIWYMCTSRRAHGLGVSYIYWLGTARPLWKW